MVQLGSLCYFTLKFTKLFYGGLMRRDSMVLTLPSTVGVIVRFSCNWYSSHFLDVSTKNSRNSIDFLGVISRREPSLEAYTVFFVLGDMPL